MRYPIYHMIVNSTDQWLSLASAAREYNRGQIPVGFGRFVIDAVDTLPRRMTKEDELKISNRADEIDAER